MIRFVLASLAVAFSCAQAADISWTAPTHNVDGTPLTDLAGYIVTYAPFGQPIAVGTVVDVPDAAATSYSLPQVDASQHWFAVQAYDSAGNPGPYATQSGWPVPVGPPGQPIQIIINY